LVHDEEDVQASGRGGLGLDIERLPQQKAYQQDYCYLGFSHDISSLTTKPGIHFHVPSLARPQDAIDFRVALDTEVEHNSII
jgi:hypothetical protein